MITVDDMMRLGLGKLLEYLDMSKDELLTFMVEIRAPTLKLLAEYLSQDTGICEYCGDNYVFILDSSICEDCLNYYESHKNWR